MAASKRQNIAVVGTGMAGLITSFLFSQEPDKYHVTVFESGDKISLDSASFTITEDDGNESRIDVPMRAMTGGYYPTLKAVYDHIGIRYQSQKMRFIFSRPGPHGPYLIHASNNHQIPPARPPSQTLLQYCFEIAFAAIFYLWLTICCWLLPPKTCPTTDLAETFHEYLRRIHMPSRFTTMYILPLLSTISTCTHRQLLSFPASDIINYRKAILFSEQLIVSGGVWQVEKALAHGLDIHPHSRVTNVSKSHLGHLTLHIQDTRDHTTHTQTFDHVILAVSPDVAATLYQPAKDSLRHLPTRSVTTIAHTLSNQLRIPRRPPVEDIYLTTTSDKSATYTNATHRHSDTLAVTSICSATSTPSLPDQKVFSQSVFTRTLRTPISKAIVDRIFYGKTSPVQPLYDTSLSTQQWTNGRDGVWMTGAWCWDGMVLLEGAAVSAVRVAKEFGIPIPWEEMKGEKDEKQQRQGGRE